MYKPKPKIVTKLEHFLDKVNNFDNKLAEYEEELTLMEQEIKQNKRNKHKELYMSYKVGDIIKLSEDNTRAVISKITDNIIECRFVDSTDHATKPFTPSKPIYEDKSLADTYNCIDLDGLLAFMNTITYEVVGTLTEEDTENLLKQIEA